MNVRKEAQRDAYEYARARMFYGEGAGTRRKLIAASINHKIKTRPGYDEALQIACDEQDMAEHAEAARKERQHKNLSKKVDRNVRGLVSGNRQNLTSGVAIVSTLAYFAHQTGYDKAIQEYVKKEYKKGKTWIDAKRSEWKMNKNLRPYKNK